MKIYNFEDVDRMKKKLEVYHLGLLDIKEQAGIYGVEWVVIEVNAILHQLEVLE